ncbi:hypothetical protein EV193_10395 [Herbihabitans rhizosphaerae]|uniref:SurA-like protein n=1 Tax=Herbihabitans rhizosphaerae TaxID=1872711 RepID=A0A4Q7KYM7_9PSEU|nr:hypothetical protein [Herbihabitans rhizosphaerae]RZS40782.1 hypothetical protein EV193_10395 [Herbihabitans rhizosphaerae]
MHSRGLLLITAAALTVGLTACGSGPSQVGSAAIIGDKVIALDDVQSDLKWVLDNVPQVQQQQKQHKLDLVSRELVSRRIQHELIAIATRRESLQIDEREVTEMINGSGGEVEAAKQNGDTPAKIREVARDILLTQALGSHYFNKLSVTFDGVVIPVRAESGSSAKDRAQALARQIADNPARARDLMRTGAGPNAQVVVDQQVTPALTERTGGAAWAGGPLFGAKAGTVIAFTPEDDNGSWLVVQVHDRKVLDPAPTNTQGKPQTLYKLGQRVLSQLADEVGLKVNPRYGVWDPLAVNVAPRVEEATGVQIPVRRTTP